jgi:hypothetical protein
VNDDRRGLFGNNLDLFLFGYSMDQLQQYHLSFKARWDGLARVMITVSKRHFLTDVLALGADHRLCAYLTLCLLDSSAVAF